MKKRTQHEIQVFTRGEFRYYAYCHEPGCALHSQTRRSAKLARAELRQLHEGTEKRGSYDT